MMVTAQTDWTFQVIAAHFVYITARLNNPCYARNYCRPTCVDAPQHAI